MNPTPDAGFPRVSTAPERVREIFLSLAKLVSAKTIYTANNPTLQSFAGAFYRSVQVLFEEEKELQLRVDQYRLLWRDQVVYESEDRGGSIAFMLFKDGVGELTLFSTVTTAELDQLVDILKEEIHNPAPNSDIVTRLWNADFANISYRVLDEDPSGQIDGERGAGARARVSPLQAEDHPGLTASEHERPGAARGEQPSSIADYLLGVVTASRPRTSDVEKEQFVQDMLSSLFSSSEDEKGKFLESFAEDTRSDKIAMLIDTALDFTRSPTPSTVENAVFLVERAAAFAIDEANPLTLVRALGLIREQARAHPTENVRAMMTRLERDLTAEAFMRTLGHREDLPTEEVLGVLRYLRAVGSSAVPVIHGLLHIHSKAVIHREACDALIAVAGDAIDTVIDSLDVDKVHVARDVVYLLGATPRAAVPPVLRELVHYPDAQVRDGALQLLSRLGGTEAVPLLCVLLDDRDKGIRMRALAALERAGGDAAAKKVMELCFGDPVERRDMDERTRLFAVAGRIAGTETVDRLEQTLNKRSWRRLGASQATRADRLLAVAALRHAGGARVKSMLERLARDDDEDVKKAAQRALEEKADGEVTPDE